MSKNIPNTPQEAYDAFSNIPVDTDDKLEQDFLHFPAGTSRFDVWHWIENHYDASIAELMQPGEDSIDVDIAPDNALYSQGTFFIHQSMETNRLEIEVAKLGWITINRTDEGLITDIYPLNGDSENPLLESALAEEDFLEDVSEEVLEVMPGPAPNSDDFSQFIVLLDAIKEVSITPEIYEAIEKTSGLNKTQVNTILDTAQERMDNRRILEEDKVIDHKLSQPKLPTP